MTIRVGIIGTGIMGSDHAHTLHRFVSGASVALLADLDESRAAAVADAIAGASATADPLALVSDDGVDAVVIASHDSTHAELIRACVAAGKPVLCEKPLSPTLDESATLLRDIGAVGAALVSLGFMRRFDPGYAELKALISGRTLGAPLLIHSVGRGISSGPGSTSESAVTNSAIHDLDIVPWLLGSPVVEVSWHAPAQSGRISGLQDPQFLLLRTADGVLSTVEMFLNARYGYDIRGEVVCEQGVARLAEPARLTFDRDLLHGNSYAADWRPRFAEAYRLELQAWIDGLLGRPRSPDMATAQDGLVASAVADAVLRSMHSGGVTTSVSVPHV